MTRPSESPSPPVERRLRLVPAPQVGLPYDDEVTETRTPRVPRDRRGTSRRAGAQGTLALAFPLPSGVPAVPTPSPRLRIVGRELAGAGQRSALLAEVPTPGRPDLSWWAPLLAQAIVEAEVGDRPLAQLARWTTDEVYDVVATRRAAQVQRTVLTRRSTARAVIASIHVCHITADIAEVCATVRCAGRARAVALRLEGSDEAWRCTAVQLG